MGKKTLLQTIAFWIWNASERFNIPLGRFAPTVFGWMISKTGKKIK